MAETATEILSAPPVGAPPAGDPPASSTPPTGTPAPSPAPGGESKWWGAFADESTRGYAETKNFPTPEEAVRSYQNLEKLLGTKANAVIVPGDDAKPEELAAFYDKLGRPGAPENYPVPATLKDDPVIKALAPKAHALGLSTKQFEGLVGTVQEQMAAAEAVKQGEQNASADADFAALRAENPGLKYDALIEHGKRAARSLGIDGETMTKMESALGTKGLVNLMGKIGAASGESPFIEGGSSNGGVPSPEAARLELASLQKDTAFMKAWMGGDAEKIAKVNKLNAAIAAGAKQ